MDWNWFFSSVAQSVAALVGILLAFVVAKLLNNQAEFSRQLGRARELIRRALAIRDAASIRYFEWYNERMLSDAVDEVTRRVQRIFEPLEEVLQDIQLPEYMPRDSALNAIRAALEQTEREQKEREEAERDRRVRASRSAGFGGVNAELMDSISRMPSGAEVQARALRNAAAEKDLADEREALRTLRVDVLDSIRHIKDLRGELLGNPESSPLIRSVLFGGLSLFLVGVIYPLSFLPVASAWRGALSFGAFFEILFSLRGGILTLTVAVFGGMIVVLWRTNAALRYPIEVLNDLAEWSQERPYSTYLEAWKQNLASSPGDARRVGPP